MTTLRKTGIVTTIAIAMAVPLIIQQAAFRELKRRNDILELRLAAALSQPRGADLNPLLSQSATRLTHTLEPPTSENGTEIIGEALRLAADLERRNPLSAFKLSQILSALSGRELAELFQRGLQFGDAGTRRSLCHAVIGFWAEKDPASALELVMKTAAPAERDEYLSAVINRWALKEPAAALVWYREAIQGENSPLSTDQSRRTTLQMISMGFAQTDPQQALALLNGTTDQAERGSVLQGIAFLARNESQRSTLWQMIDQMTVSDDRRTASSASSASSEFRIPLGQWHLLKNCQLVMSAQPLHRVFYQR